MRKFKIYQNQTSTNYKKRIKMIINKKNYKNNQIKIFVLIYPKSQRKIQIKL